MKRWIYSLLLLVLLVVLAGCQRRDGNEEQTEGARMLPGSRSLILFIAFRLGQPQTWALM